MITPLYRVVQCRKSTKTFRYCKLCRQVLTLSTASRFAPLLIRTWTVLEWPSSQAIIRGVRPRCIVLVECECDNDHTTLTTIYTHACIVLSLIISNITLSTIAIVCNVWAMLTKLQCYELQLKYCRNICLSNLLPPDLLRHQSGF